MTSIDEITQIEQIPMSDTDVKYYLGDDARVLTYDELAKYNTLEELLPESHCSIIPRKKRNKWTLLCIISIK